MIPKFRAWVPKFKKICPVIEIRYKGNTNEEIYYIKVPSQSGLSRNGYSTFDFCLMQSTGMKDTNGNEIYEGDILEISGYDIDNKIIVVGWDTTDGAYTMEDISGEILLTTIWWKIHEGDILFKVIGNIYENQELVKSQIPHS